MSHELLHIYGPFAIQWYGVMILLGLLAFIWRASKHPLRKKYLTETQFVNLVTYSIIAGIVGGRLLSVLGSWRQYDQVADIFKIWEGGFSILGTIIAVALFASWYLWRHHIPVMPVLDLAGLYAPLTQAISRIGCFFAGCCHGIVTTVAWAVPCDNPATQELLGVLVHPTQLYSSAALFLIFLIIRFLIYPHAKKQGQLFASYLILAGLERFVLDFWRGDRTVSGYNYISAYQALALFLVCAGIGLLIYCTFVKPKNYEHI